MSAARTLRPTSFLRFRTRFSPFYLMVWMVFLIWVINSSTDLQGEHPKYFSGEFLSTESLNGSPFKNFRKLRFLKTPFLNLLNLVFYLSFFTLITSRTFYHWTLLNLRLFHDNFYCFMPLITISGQIYATNANLIETFSMIIFFSTWCFNRFRLYFDWLSTVVPFFIFR